MKYVIAKSSRDEVIGAYTVYLCGGIFWSSDINKAKRFSWLGAQIKVWKERRKPDPFHENRYCIKRITNCGADMRPTQNNDSNALDALD